MGNHPHKTLNMTTTNEQAETSRKSAINAAANALYKLKLAFAEVSENWQDEMNEGYPFSAEFEELTNKVGDWADDASNKLYNKLYQK